MKFLCSAILLLAGSLALGQPQPAPVPAGQKVFATGRVEPKNVKQLIQQSHLLYGHKLKNLPKVTAASWDCRTLGLVGPVQDQGNCGSCWDFSGTDICSSCLYKAGVFKNDGSAGSYLCQQYILDCVQSGGCNGDDNTTVTAAFVRNGMPTQAEYGPYQARSGRCKSGTKMYLGKDTGFCTTSNNQGVAAVQDIKNAMVAYGPIGSAIAADNSFMNVQPGQVFTGRSHSINHDIVLVGWDDAKGKSVGAETAWILRNSWGTSWCDGGYCWIAAGANDVGTEAIWVTAGPPPTPPAAPVITSATSAPAVVGTQFLYQIVASNSPGVFGASGLPAGITIATDTGIVTGIPTTAGTFNVTLSAANPSGVGTAPLVITVTGTGPPPPPPPGPAGAPVITSAPAAFVAPGAAMSYQITATNNPIAFNASGLPAGLTVSQSSGLVSGSVATAGTYNIQLMALNFSGVGSSTLVLTVGSGPVPGNINIKLRGIVITNVTQGEVISILSDIGIKKEMSLGDFTGFMGRCFPMAPTPPAKSLKSTTKEPPLQDARRDMSGWGFTAVPFDRTRGMQPVDRRLMPTRSR